MTAETLKSKSVKDLAEMAKKRGIAGWHGMRKEQLIKALLRMAARKANAAASVQRRSSATPNRPAVKSLAAKSLAAKPLAVKSMAVKAVAVANNGLRRAANGVSPVAKAATNGRPTVPAAPAAARPATNGTANRPVIGKPAASTANGNKPAQAAPAKPQPLSAAAKAALAQDDAKDRKLSLAAKKLLVAKMKHERMKDLAWRTIENKGKGSLIRDRLVLMVRDAYWLHCYWELSRHGVERAQASLAQDWHTAKPTLRLLHTVEGGTTSSAELLVRDIEIHGGVNNWYIEAPEPPQSFRVEIGYRTANNRFHTLARSNVVTTPRPDSKDAIDENWNAVAQDYDKIYAMSGGYSTEGNSAELQELFEERLRRPMGSPLVTGFGSGVEGLVPRRKEFAFDVDAEMLVFGKTEPNAHVTLQGDPVKVRPDGTFTVRFAMPNARQVIPAVASSADGLEQRTVVLAVERNTKVMEPVVRDSSDS